MSSTTAAPVSGTMRSPAPREPAGLPAHVLEQAADFGQLVSEALEDALRALAHPSPEQYLQLLAARRREHAPYALPGVGRAPGADVEVGVRSRNATVVQELSRHMAFEILQAARRYACFLSSIGDYPVEAAPSARRHANLRSAPAALPAE